MPGLPSQRRRRVTYVLPLPTDPLPQLVLPHDVGRRPGEPRPLVLRRDGLSLFAPPADAATSIATQVPAGHPQHRLGVSALALDTSTIVVNGQGDPSPKGILYSAGRDGLLASWELDLPMRKRRRRYGSGRRARLARTMRWGDEEVDEEAVEVNSSDEEDVRPSARKARRSSSLAFGDVEGVPDPRRSSRSERSSSPHLAYEERWEIASDELDGPESVRPHTDWINAIALCNLNRTVISASSDHTIRAWSPHDAHSSMRPSVIGQHADYVKTLAVSRDAGWVASGGFDRQVKLWDVHESRAAPLLHLPDDASPNSIYSLATNAAGSLLAIGSPERAVRVWDPRSSKQVCRLIGHTDNVRAMLLSDDGQLLLTGSSDSNIKLWSMREQRCMHTFSFHSDSVWSLYSHHPYLDSFYSGDRTGLVCKVDLEDCGDYADGDCVVLLSEGDKGEDPSGGNGINCIVAADDSYVWTATGSSGFKRWQDVPRRSSRSRAALPSPSRSPMIDSMPAEDEEPLLPSAAANGASPLFMRKSRHPSTGQERFSPTVSFAPEPVKWQDLQRTVSNNSTRSVPPAASPHSPAASHRPPSLRLSSTPGRSSLAVVDSPQAYHTANDQALPTLRGLPYESLVPLVSLDDPYQPRTFLHPDHPAASSAAFSARSLSFHRATFSAASHHSLNATSPAQELPPDPARQAREEYEVREEANEALPLRLTPDEIVHGLCGLVSCEVLNDRRHVLTADKHGDLALWDIVLGVCLGGFARDDIDAALGYDSIGDGERRGGRPIKDALELVRERIEGEAATGVWSSVDVRTGGISVHLEEGRVFDGEHYADSAGFADFLTAPHQRVNLGKTVLRALFDGFIVEELRLRAAGQQPYALQQAQTTTETLRLSRPKAPLHISLANLNDVPKSQADITAGGMSIALATPALTPVLPPVAADRAATLRSRDPSLTPISETPGLQARMPFFDGLREAATPRQADGTDYFATRTVPSKLAAVTPAAPETPSSPAQATSGGFMGRLKGLGRKQKGGAEAQNKDEAGASTATASGETTTDETSLSHPHLSMSEVQQLNLLRTVFAKPLAPCPSNEAPPIEMSPNVIVVITEEVAETATWQSIYRGTAASTGGEAEAIELASPAWLLEFLLGNRVATRDPVKVSFVMSAWHSAAAAGLEELPDGNNRLSANRVLRIAKVAHYCAEKLNEAARTSPAQTDSVTAAQRNVSHTSLTSSAMPSRRTSIASNEGARGLTGDDLDILVGDEVLPLTVTLAAALRFWQRRPGDLLLNYRLKGHST